MLGTTKDEQTKMGKPTPEQLAILRFYREHENTHMGRFADSARVPEFEKVHDECADAGWIDYLRFTISRNKWGLTEAGAAVLAHADSAAGMTP